MILNQYDISAYPTTHLVHNTVIIMFLDKIAYNCTEFRSIVINKLINVQVSRIRTEIYDSH
jgi:hypothetical protein